MPAHSVDCPDCGKAVDYWKSHCRCGHFLGYPNFRRAEAEKGELLKRYDAARRDASSRGAATLLAKLEMLAEQSHPVIVMSFNACDDILRSDKYRSYHQRVDSGEREPAQADHHSDREMVGARLFPMYHQGILYASLSHDGRGLLNYGGGAVAVRWQVTSGYLGRRASLLEENSFLFYDRHGLGRRGTAIPPGYQAVWEDRAKLVAAKLAPRLTTATAEGSLVTLLLHAGRTRDEDDFIEIAIYANEGLDSHDVDMVTVQRPPTTSEETHRLELVREICAARGIALME